MIDLDELLAPLADGSLGDPLPVDEIRARVDERGRRGRARRLAFVGVAATVVLVVGVAAVVASVDRPVQIELVPSMPTSAPTSIVPATTAAPALVADPLTPLPVGNFPYDMASSGSDLWVLNRFGNDVTRISTDTHEVRSTVALPGGPTGAQPTRLAVTDDAVWVAGAKTVDSPGGIARIDRASEAVTFVPLDITAYSMAVDGDDLWVAGRFEVVTSSGSGPLIPWAVRRVDRATGTIEQSITGRSGGFPVDVAVTDEGVWVLLQSGSAESNRLVHIDPATSSIIGETPIDGGSVRLVATGDELVIGTDTSGLSGRTGAVMLVDPATGAVTATTALDTRPEAIVLVDDVIITSGLRVLDRRTLAERSLPPQDHRLGFALARSGNDLWFTDVGEAPDTSVVRRAPLSSLR